MRKQCCFIGFLFPAIPSESKSDVKPCCLSIRSCNLREKLKKKLHSRICICFCLVWLTIMILKATLANQYTQIDGVHQMYTIKYVQMWAFWMYSVSLGVLVRNCESAGLLGVRTGLWKGRGGGVGVTKSTILCAHRPCAQEH